MVCVNQNLKCQTLFQYHLQCLCKYCLFLHEQWNCLNPYNNFFHFYHILVLHNHTKTHTFQFYSDLILMNINKQAYSLAVSYYQVTYEFQSKSTLCTCLNVRERLTQCSLAEWLSVCLQSKWLWVRIMLQSLIH